MTDEVFPSVKLVRRVGECAYRKNRQTGEWDADWDVLKLRRVVLVVRRYETTQAGNS